jgi:hypothetical protein
MSRISSNLVDESQSLAEFLESAPPGGAKKIPDLYVHETALLSSGYTLKTQNLRHLSLNRKGDTRGKLNTLRHFTLPLLLALQLSLRNFPQI